ncbi:MAG TPA: hypothetical protein VGK25_04375 [Ignavibacteria bacterium]|jgi:hypothetical protein
MATGPSKEELKMYWESSRQYFDELANYYRTADPQYYNEYIAPFYSNPFISAGTKSGSRRGTAIGVLAVGILLMGLAAGVAVFFLASGNDSSDDDNTSPKIERKIEKVQPKDTIKTTTPKTQKERNNRKQPIERIR